MKDSSFIVVTIFSSALAHALSCVGKPDIYGFEGQAGRGTEAFVWWERRISGTYQVYSKSICFQALPFLFDVKLGRV